MKIKKGVYRLRELRHKKITKRDIISYCMIGIGCIAGISLLLTFIFKLIFIAIITGISIALEYGCAIWLFYVDKGK